MTSWIQRAIRAVAAPDHRLRCRPDVWQAGWKELRRRGDGHRESGAVLLGWKDGDRRVIEQFVYYDDLDPHALDTGIITFDGGAYPALWERCRQTGWEVVADVHTHPGLARQSSLDREHPMIARSGHVGLIIPDFAQGPPVHQEMANMGIYEYLGAGEWSNHSGRDALQYFYVSRWA